MAKHSERALSVSLRAAAITVTLLALVAVNAKAASLSGSIGGGAKFPARTLLLSAPPGVPVSVPRIYVSENGRPVDKLSVTPVTAAQAGDFGVVIVIDQSQSMRGSAIAQAMVAARAIAAQRTGKQELGVITFASRATVVLPLTSNRLSIDWALAKTPPIETGTRILPAVIAGLKQLASANIADGAVILVSDGAGAGPGALTPQSVAATARAQHTRIFTVGLRDSSFTPGLMRRLAELGGGKFVATTGGQLPRVFTGIASALSSSYLLRYQSILSAGQPVAVTVRVDGVPSLLNLGYYAPAGATSSTTSGATSSGAPSSSATPSGAKSSPSSRTPAKAPAAPHRAVAPAAAGIPATTLSSVPGATLTGIPPATGPGVSSAAAPAKTSPPPAHGTPRQAPWSVQPTRAGVTAGPPQSFWTSSLGTALIAGSCALLIGLGIAVLLFRRPARLAVQRRVHSFGAASSTAEPTVSGLTADAGGAGSQLLMRSSWWPAFAERVETARMRRSPLAVVKRWALTSLLAAILLGYATGTPALGMLLLIVSPFVLKVRVARGVRRQQSRFSEQLPSHLQDLAGAMRGGRSFVGGIAAMAESASEPLRGEFQRAVSDERLGLPLEETLEAIGRRMEAKDMEQIALIAALQRGSGSNAAEALERVAESSRERADLRREMKALTGQARMSAAVLTGMPPVMLLALTFIAPKYQKPLLHTTPGIVLLFVACGMLGAAWMVMSKIVNAEA